MQYIIRVKMSNKEKIFRETTEKSYYHGTTVEDFLYMTKAGNSNLYVTTSKLVAENYSDRGDDQIVIELSLEDVLLQEDKPENFSR